MYRKVGIGRVDAIAIFKIWYYAIVIFAKKEKILEAILPCVTAAVQKASKE